MSSRGLRGREQCPVVQLELKRDISSHDVAYVVTVSTRQRSTAMSFVTMHEVSNSVYVLHESNA